MKPILIVTAVIIAVGLALRYHIFNLPDSDFLRGVGLGLTLAGFIIAGIAMQNYPKKVS